MIEPMIEPIFVILGILASVAIPRLAATREDAEISAAVANLRTLVSDASAYYVAKGSFNPNGAANATKWNQITNVSLVNTNAATNAAVGNNNNNSTAYLKVGNQSCIGVNLVEKTTTAPAYIKFTANGTNSRNGVCAQVLNAAPVKAYLDATGVGSIKGTIAIGSNTSVYK